MEKKKQGKVACESCRRQKIRCDCESPCSNCKKSGRLCSYSPHRKRGPVPKAHGTAEVDEEVSRLEEFAIPVEGKASLAHLVNYYFSVFFGRVCNFFEIPQDFVPSDPPILSASMSKPKKFTLLASLACCARCAGNAPLGEKLFELARGLSRNFYDEDNLEEPDTVAFGFAQLAIYAAATDPKRAQRYNYLSKAIFEQVPKDETKRASMHLFLNLVWEMIHPAQGLVSVSFPLGETPSDNPAVSPQRPYPMLLAESFSFVSLTDAGGFVNPFIPRWIFDHELKPADRPDPPPELFTLACYEFVSFLRITLASHFPGMASIIRNTEIKEEFFQLAPGVIPPGLVDSLLKKVDSITRNPLREEPEVSQVYLLVFLAPLLCAVNRIPEAHSRVLEATVCCQMVDIHDMILLSPATLSVPTMLIGCWILLKVHDLDTFDILAGFLRHFSDIGFLNAKSGLSVLLKLKADIVAKLNVPYTPFNPDHLHGGPKRLLNPQCPREEYPVLGHLVPALGSPQQQQQQQQHSSPSPVTVSSTSSSPGSPKHQAEADSAGGEIGGHLQASLSLAESQAPLEAMEVFSNYLNPENDKGVFPELEFLMKEGGQFDFSFR